MKFDIPSKNMVKGMVEDAVRKDMNNVYNLLDRFRKRLGEIEKKIEKKRKYVK